MYKTAWTMRDRLRAAVGAEAVGTRLRGAVEIDDPYYGGHRKGKRGRGAAGKPLVVEIRQRGGRVRNLRVPAMQR
jgi:transposase-like protein